MSQQANQFIPSKQERTRATLPAAGIVAKSDRQRSVPGFKPCVPLASQPARDAQNYSRHVTFGPTRIGGPSA
jgi:hypothetical protein